MNTLQNNVINQLGYDSLDEECMSTLEDVSQHGASGGFGQFVYYTDTIKFAEDNLQDILAMARDMADELGEDGAYSLVASFNCLGRPDYTPDSVADAIHDPNHEDYTQVMNALAWFALEETARELTES